MRWMLYGANGYTGRLVLGAALARGLRPVVAGRDAAAIRTLAAADRLEARSFALDDGPAIAAALDDVALVLSCAGPFSATCAPLLEACLSARAHYVDVTGEIDVFAHCHAEDARARAAGIVVLPGAGFDVVPTDCVAAMLKEELPDARELVLAFEAEGGVSRGTARTGIEGLAHGGRVRRGGELVHVPLAWKTRTFERNGRDRTAMTIPWGDVYTSYVSTGIPDVEVYMAVPPATVQVTRWLRVAQPVLGLGLVQRLLKRRVDTRVGPDASRRASSRCHVWGEARNAAGDTATLELDTPNGYTLTASAALGIVEQLLADARPAGGYYTPSQLMGARYVLGLPGVTCRKPP